MVCIVWVRHQATLVPRKSKDFEDRVSLIFLQLYWVCERRGEDTKSRNAIMVYHIVDPCAAPKVCHKGDATHHYSMVL